MSNNNQHRLVSNDPYYIDPERYLELKHFCKQYPMWVDAYSHLDGLSKLSKEELDKLNPTGSVVEVRDRYMRWIKLIDDAARAAAPEVFPYIRIAVTKDRSYDYISSNIGMVPCDSVTFRQYVHKFFYILSSMRD